MFAQLLIRLVRSDFLRINATRVLSDSEDFQHNRKYHERDSTAAELAVAIKAALAAQAAA